MTRAKNGDTVKVHYMGRLEDGRVFETTKNHQPLEFVMGSGKIIPGFEKSVLGMEVGDTKTIRIPPDEAYGPRRQDLIVDIKKSDFPDNIRPAIGQRLQIRQPNGHFIDVIIMDMNEDLVTLDANHPLAGNSLIFDVELVEIA